MSEQKPMVGIVMGSKSDWEVMQHSSETLKLLQIPHEVKVVSAHRTPGPRAQLDENLRKLLPGLQVP